MSWRFEAVKTMFKRLKIDCVAVFMGSASLIFLWHMGNSILPTNDFATYLDYTSSIYRAFRDSGLVAAMTSAYWDRGWRPIFFPILGAPFLAICQGDLLCAVSLTMATLAGITGLFAYLIARLYIPAGLAVCVVPIFFSIPGWNSAYHLYYSEAAWIPAILAATYYGILVLRLGSSRGAWFGLALSCAFAMLIRPVETILTISVPLAFWAWEVTRVYGRSIWYRRNFILSASVLIVLVAGWWLPFVPQLFSWVFDTSFGTMAKETDQKMAGMSVLAVVEHIFYPLFVAPPITSWPIVVAFVIVVRALPRSLILVAVGLSALILTAIALQITGTSDERRTYAALAVFLIGILTTSASVGPLYKVRAVVVNFRHHGAISFPA